MIPKEQLKGVTVSDIFNLRPPLPPLPDFNPPGPFHRPDPIKDYLREREIGPLSRPIVLDLFPFRAVENWKRASKLSG